MPAAAITICDATHHHIPTIQQIYAYHVQTGTASFEEVPPSTAQMEARHADIQRLGLPYLVAELEGAVVGYAYASSYRPRPAYRYTIEDSVYVAHEHPRRGIGGALLAALIARCEAGPWRQMIAMIGDSDNAASIHLHRRFGFRDVGALRNVGWKLGRWLDSVVMQRALGPGADTLPTSEPHDT
jgi:L-amino acid N-acyltransferase YncA